MLPILVSDAEPGMPFLDQFHRLSLLNHSYGDLIDLVLQTLDGAEISDTTPLWRLVNPYRGLPAMGAQDAAFFFGREELTGEILRRISTIRTASMCWSATPASASPPSPWQVFWRRSKAGSGLQIGTGIGRRGCRAATPGPR